MEYTLRMGLWNSVFAVPTALVDRYLLLAEKEQLQALLWLLRHGGETVRPEELGKILGISAGAAEEALEYWVQEGLLAGQDGELTPAAQPRQAEDAPAAEAAKPGAAPRRRMPRPDVGLVAARMEESEGFRFLMQEAENTLGRTLSPAMASTLLAICDDYGLPVEVVATLLHYAKNVGKTGTAYIDSVARDWAASGIFTLDAAEEKLCQLDQRRQAWAKVQSTVGMARRAPSRREEELAWQWVFQWKFTGEMLAAAYERCVDNTGKFSASYMNKVLEGWHNSGVRNPGELERMEARRKAQGAASKSYDIDDLEKMSGFDLPEEL